MKSLVKILTIAVFVFTAVSIHAQDATAEFTARNAGARTLFFETKNATAAHLDIRIQDKNGLTLFSEYVKNPATFERNYNLEELVDGDYLLLVEGDSKTQILPFTILANELKINFNSKEVVQKMAAYLEK